MLVKRHDQWALVSKTNPNKILKWFGYQKPTPEQVLKEERRVQFFKNKLVPVKTHVRNGKIVTRFVRRGRR